MNLSALYTNPDQAFFLHSQYYVEGCLLGACACPEIPLPDVWLPWVIKHHGQIQNVSQADSITNDLFAFFKHCLAQMHANNLSLPEYVKYSTVLAGQDSADENYPLKQWCLGLLTAHSASENVWQGAWHKMQQQDPDLAPKLAKNLKHCLLVFSTFAEPEKAIIKGNVKNSEQNQDVQTLADNLPIIAKSLNTTLKTYVDIAGELAAYLPNQFETFEKKVNTP